MLIGVQVRSPNWWNMALRPYLEHHLNVMSILLSLGSLSCTMSKAGEVEDLSLGIYPPIGEVPSG
jgi:hypothetical protein